MTNIDYALLAQVTRRAGITTTQLERAASGIAKLEQRTPMALYRVETYHVSWLERWWVWWRAVKGDE